MLILSDLTFRPLASTEAPLGTSLRGLVLGNGSSPLEVVLATAMHQPAATELHALWRARSGGRAAPVVVCIQHGDDASLRGPSSDVVVRTTATNAERLLRVALAAADRHAARSLLDGGMDKLSHPLFGLWNQGLFATHHLLNNVPERSDWKAACAAGVRSKSLRGRELLEGLGYTAEALPTSSGCMVLRHGGTRVALAILVQRGTRPDDPSTTYNGLSAVSYALAKGDEENLPYVLVQHEDALRLYATNPAAGAGRRGRTETYFQADLGLLDDSMAGYLWLLFSAASLARSGAVEQVLEESGNYAVSLGARLRERVYQSVVPGLATGIATVFQVQHDIQDLRELYEVALTVLFRLLFIAYAEDRQLLPVSRNASYRVRSLKHKAREFAERDPAKPWDDSSTLWHEVQALFSAVDKGRKEWGVPAYNGGLFSNDKSVSRIGNLIDGLQLTDAVFGPVLSGLLVDEGPDGRGPVDFRSLGVREFGTIYEGLLESELAIAETDLVEDASTRALRPTKRASEAVVVFKSQFYLHNSSGQRKGTGSYFTKSFIVDHLLDEALEPSLKDHLARLDALTDPTDAARRFFDFRAADISMGSGHFLVSVVDRIERALSGYIARRPLPAVGDELARLRKAAEEACKAADTPCEVEDAQLLRRQIARRCIYGVDLNQTAVELARLSLWIHTFVPGLPLSFLSHNLVRGDSLLGVGTLDEAAAVLGGNQLFGAGVRKMLTEAKSDLERLGRISDADRAEIEQARLAAAEARKKVEPLNKVLDYVVASRINESIAIHQEEVDPEKTLRRLAGREIQARVAEVLGTPPLHFPVAFAEVFLRDRSGFDVIIGNPPWEELTLERDRFWVRHIPGLHGLAQGEIESAIKKAAKARPDLVAELEREGAAIARLRSLVLASGYPGMGTGDPDLYKAFLWRFWRLLAVSGRIGVVLPRSALQAKGGAEFRTEIFKAADIEGITTLLNSGGWVFDEVEPRYTIALATLRRSPTANPNEPVVLRGPYRSLASFMARSSNDGVRFSKAEILGWTDTTALPLLPSEQSGTVFAQLRKAPRLDRNVPTEWRARPYREFDATNDRIGGPKAQIIDVTSAQAAAGFWPVFTGESFDLWDPDTGSYYGRANVEVALAALSARRADGTRHSKSPFFELTKEAKRVAGDQNQLDANKPRIAFRDITRSTDSRTVRAALVPPKVFLTNKAPYFVWPRGDEKDVAYLLGVLCSLPLDWYARRFVEVSLNYHILNPFPVPRPRRSDVRWSRVVELAGRLACVDKRYKVFANAIGVEFGPLDPDEKADMVAEIDAVVAHLYGLSAEQLRHIFETFHEGWDFEDRFVATLKHFERSKGQS